MLTKASFISTTINNSVVVKSTKVDSTIKAIINNYKRLNGKFKYYLYIYQILTKLEQNSIYIIDYLNTLRINYYLSRLSYFNKDKYKSTLSK